MSFPFAPPPGISGIVGRMESAPCFHSGFLVAVALSYEFNKNKQLDHESEIHFPFITAIDHSFCGFTGAINHLMMLEEHSKSL